MLSAVVLLVANASRAWMFRPSIDVAVSRWFLVGAVPAAAVGGLLLPFVPARAVQVGVAVLLLVFVAERVARGRGEKPRVSVPLRAFAAVGAVSGLLSATVGGSGPFSAPFFNARGLNKEGFVATNAASNGTVHAVKTVAFLVTGLLTSALLVPTAVAAGAVVLGNKAGQLVLGRMREETFVRLLLVALTVAAVRLLLP